MYILLVGDTRKLSKAELENFYTQYKDRYPLIAQQIQAAIAAEDYKIAPRSRSAHSLSDGESDSEDPSIFYRSLRPEEDPFNTGLRPPQGCDPSITASQHVVAGSKAKIKSAEVSFTRSLKVASAWAAKRNGRVAKVKLPPYTKHIDLTQPSQARKVFPALKGTSYNQAKASQEVLIKFGLGSESVLDVYDVRKLSVSEYNKLKGSSKSAIFIRSRSTAKSSPTPAMLTPQQRQIVQIEDDGHCLFRAINYVRSRNISDYKVLWLRRIIKIGIETDDNIKQALNPAPDRLRDLTNMNVNIVWGGDEEIQVASYLLKCRIILHGRAPAPEIFDGIAGLPNYSSERIYADIHLHYTAGHFNAML